MEQETVARFLLHEVIPRVKPPEGISPSRCWDAIWRAHRDVLAGRFHLPQYIALQKNTRPITKSLYNSIMNRKATNTPLDSSSLIEELVSEYPSVEFGALQKLVNMSLKYIVCLNAFEPDFAIAVDESNCDCPLDSRIIGLLPNRHKPWTKMSDTDYEAAQKDVRLALCGEQCADKGGLYYDFMHREP